MGGGDSKINDVQKENLNDWEIVAEKNGYDIVKPIRGTGEG